MYQNGKVVGRDTEIKFGQGYIKHDILWDMHDEFYKNKQIHYDAYMTISAVGTEDFRAKEIAQKIKKLSFYL